MSVLIKYWGLRIGPNTQSPIPNPQSPFVYIIKLVVKLKKFKLIINNLEFKHKINGE